MEPMIQPYNSRRRWGGTLPTIGPNGGRYFLCTGIEMYVGNSVSVFFQPFCLSCHTLLRTILDYVLENPHASNLYIAARRAKYTICRTRRLVRYLGELTEMLARLLRCRWTSRWHIPPFGEFVYSTEQTRSCFLLTL